jgi:hypothetical protein
VTTAQRLVSLSSVALLCSCMGVSGWVGTGTGSGPDGDLPADQVLPTDPPTRDVPASSGPVGPGGRCECDGDCEATMGYAPLCIHGICGVRSVDDRCPAGSDAACPPGHRCWSGTGLGICYPDFVAGSCAGASDDYGSCVTDGSFDCFGVCGGACDDVGEPEGDWEPVEQWSDECGGLDHFGECEGSVARWCEDGEIQAVDCEDRNQVCGWYSDAVGYFCSYGAPQDDPIDPDDTADPDDVETQLRHCVDVINQHRARLGLGALSRSSELEDCAMEGARSDAASGVPHDHFSRTGGCGVAFAENEVPGWDVGMSGSVVAVIEEGTQMMMDEGPGGGHYENIVGARNAVGCGVYVTASGAVWVVQDFN